MKKTIYISWTPLTQQMENDWYISFLIEKGISVEYWDLSKLLFRDIDFENTISRDYLKIILTYDQLEKLIACHEAVNTHFLILVKFEWRFNRLFRLLNRYNCRLYHFEWGHGPYTSAKTYNRFTKFALNPIKLTKAIYYRFMTKISYKCKLVKPFDVVFAAGNAPRHLHPKSSSIIPINFIDYDKYKDSRMLPRLIDKPYCLFLDIYLVSQPDIAITRSQYLSADIYLNSLNNFFKTIESKYHLQVIIAAHPKSNYSYDTFKGRAIVKDQTALLSRDAEFVISHHSASISYAILNLKPIIFIYTDEIKQLYPDTVFRYTKDLSNFLDAAIYNINEIKSKEQVEINMLNQNKYLQYKYEYLTTPSSEDMWTKDIFLNELTTQIK